MKTHVVLKLLNKCTVISNERKLAKYTRRYSPNFSFPMHVALPCCCKRLDLTAKGWLRVTGSPDTFEVESNGLRLA